MSQFPDFTMREKKEKDDYISLIIDFPEDVIGLAGLMCIHVSDEQFLSDGTDFIELSLVDGFDLEDVGWMRVRTCQEIFEVLEELHRKYIAGEDLDVAKEKDKDKDKGKDREDPGLDSNSDDENEESE
jgi:hypothetical protein